MLKMAELVAERQRVGKFSSGKKLRSKSCAQKKTTTAGVWCQMVSRWSADGAMVTMVTMVKSHQLAAPRGLKTDLESKFAVGPQLHPRGSSKTCTQSCATFWG